MNGRRYPKGSNSMRIGEHRILKNGYPIRELWLTKWVPTKEYQVWGLCIDKDGKATGWCVLFSGTLKQARDYATLMLFD